MPKKKTKSSAKGRKARRRLSAKQRAPAAPGRRRRKASGVEKRPRPEHLKHSKSEGFLEKIRDNSMVEYFTRLRILNPAAQLVSTLNEPRREGGFVRLAHAREEFTAPVISKGKSVQSGKDRLPAPEEE